MVFLEHVVRGSDDFLWRRGYLTIKMKIASLSRVKCKILFPRVFFNVLFTAFQRSIFFEKNAKASLIKKESTVTFERNGMSDDKNEYDNFVDKNEVPSIVSRFFSRKKSYYYF